jgi:hypothetical protein
MARSVRSAMLAVLAALFTYGCTKSNSEEPRATPNYLFFADNSNTCIQAVDPRDATTVILDQGSTTYPNLLETGSVTSSGLLTGVETRALLWLRDDGSGNYQAFKVDAPVGSRKTRMSTLSLPAANVCNMQLFPDHAHPSESTLVILAKASPAADCFTAADVSVYLLRLSMGPTTDPLVATSTLYFSDRIQPVYAPNGAIAQWLMTDGSQSFVEPANLTTSHTVQSGWWTPLAQTPGRLWVSDGAGYLKYLAHDGTSFQEPGGATTTMPSITDPANAPDYPYTADESYLYWVDLTRILRVKLDGSAAPELIHAIPPGGRIRSLTLTSGKVVYSDNVTKAFHAIPRAGGAPAQIDPILAPGVNVGVQAAGSSLFFADIDNQRAYSMAEDGTDLVEFVSSTHDINWFFTRAATRPFSGNATTGAARAILVDDSPSDAGVFWARSYDAATRRGGVFLGSFPAGWGGAFAMAETSGTKMLMGANGPGGSDLFLADAAADFSVVQITSTSVAGGYYGPYWEWTGTGVWNP